MSALHDTSSQAHPVYELPPAPDIAHEWSPWTVSLERQLVDARRQCEVHRRSEAILNALNQRQSDTISTLATALDRLLSGGPSPEPGSESGMSTLVRDLQTSQRDSAYLAETIIDQRQIIERQERHNSLLLRQNAELHLMITRVIQQNWPTGSVGVGDR